MQKSTYAMQLPAILASIDNGKDAPEDIQPPGEQGEPEEFDVYVEPDRITVIKRPEPQAQVIEAIQPPQQQPYFAYVVMTISLLLLCYLVTSACITAFFPPIITITLLTKSQTINATGTIQLPARQIPPITLSESQSVPTTGRGHQDARAAQGTITFYNGLFTSQTVQAGTVLTGADAVQIITDQDAYIPEAYPPSLGYATVSAHALTRGSSGNISAYDINQACCATAIKAVNTTSFSGGLDERDFQIVTKKDIASRASALKTTISQSMQGALQTQQKSGEALSILPCSPQVTTDHHVGAEASTVHMTVSETCQGYAYSKASFLAQAATILSRRAGKELGAGYTRMGTLHVTENSTRITKNTVTITFTSQGVYGYALSKQTQSHIKHLLTGKRKHDAERFLLSLPGIQQAVITGIDDLSKLPKNPNEIHMLVIIPESS
jgi:hypothetical protein